jgi:N-acyl-D-aspartate/D-glutamate deacylase
MSSDLTKKRKQNVPSLSVPDTDWGRMAFAWFKGAHAPFPANPTCVLLSRIAHRKARAAMSRAAAPPPTDEQLKAMQNLVDQAQKLGMYEQPPSSN